MNSISVDWVVPALRKPACGFFLWNLTSLITVIGASTFSKVLVHWFNIAKIHNRAYFNECFENRLRNVPLITVSNHYSCFDDPGIWGCVKLKHTCSTKMRWALAAHDICFKTKLHSYFFMLGKCIPIVRGKGVYQDAMEFCLERLKNGEWLHIFPEGRVNVTKEIKRLKWGVGRLVYDAPVTPIVIPMWIIGMDQVLPNTPPYVLKSGKKLTFNFGKPINFTNLIKELRESKVNAETAHKAITDKIHIDMLNLKFSTDAWHKLYFSLY